MNLELPECFYRISVKALILDETRTKFLLAREDNGYWEIPGGGLDWGEDAMAALLRELREEMGLEASFVSLTPSYFLTFQNEFSRHDLRTEKAWRANVIYEVTLASLDFTPSEECLELRFVSPEEVKQLLAFSNVRQLAQLFDPKNHVR